VGFAESVRACFGKFADFQGRASRSEFWWFFLFSVLVSLGMTIPLYVLMAIAAVAGDNAAGAGLAAVIAIIWSIAVVIITIVLLIPLLAVGARRLHDYGQSAWFLLLYFVPCGNLVLIVLWALGGTPGDNPYGPRPVR
jgi:uncharacterized membrane protein YhaH (DUF805 family)